MATEIDKVLKVLVLCCRSIAEVVDVLDTGNLLFEQTDELSEECMNSYSIMGQTVTDYGKAAALHFLTVVFTVVNCKWVHCCLAVFPASVDLIH